MVKIHYKNIETSQLKWYDHVQRMATEVTLNNYFMEEIVMQDGGTRDDNKLKESEDDLRLH